MCDATRQHTETFQPLRMLNLLLHLLFLGTSFYSGGGINGNANQPGG